MVIAFTGHRPHKLWGYVDLRAPEQRRENDGQEAAREKYRDLFRVLWSAVLKEWVNREEELLLVSGMAIGVDQVAAQVGIQLRDKRHLNIKVEAAIPCLQQDAKWTASSRQLYNDILRQCDYQTLVYNGSYLSNPRCMQQRNEYMVDKADVLIAVWDGSNGGTGNCVKYAKKKGVKIIQIDPRKI